MHYFLTSIYKTFDPKKRLTVDQALEHPYLQAYASLSPLSIFSTVVDIMLPARPIR
jgi:hypothetical protein